MRSRDFPLLWRAIIALTLAYASFLAEVFRAGIQSVDPGQIEAAKALGLKPWPRFRLVVWPQAFRTVLPPWGNDFVAMVKDSSLVSVLGVTDITQLGKVTAAGNFRYFETYNVVALIYLVMTVGLSLALRRLERRLQAPAGLSAALWTIPAAAPSLAPKEIPMNPLLAHWTTPFELPPFDTIADADFAPAFDAALAEARAAVAKIADNPEPPTFANTIEALELSDQTHEPGAGGVLQPRRGGFEPGARSVAARILAEAGGLCRPR